MAKGPTRFVASPHDRDLFESLYPELRRFAAYVADADIEPDDLVQDALLSTLQRYELSELDHPAAYLKRAVFNKAANRRRGLSRLRAALSQIRPETGREDEYLVEFTVLDTLDPIDRAILYLADVVGLPLDTVASDLGLTSVAVRKRASRAREKLRKELGTYTVQLQEGR